MATTIEYKDFILEQLSLLEDITCKPMMGEYLLYYKGILFGGIYDDRLLLKINEGNKKYRMIEELPYDGAKPMFLVEDVDDKEMLRQIIEDTCDGIKRRKAWAFLLCILTYLNRWDSYRLYPIWDEQPVTIAEVYLRHPYSS